MKMLIAFTAALLLTVVSLSAQKLQIAGLGLHGRAVLDSTQTINQALVGLELNFANKAVSLGAGVNPIGLSNSPVITGTAYGEADLFGWASWIIRPSLVAGIQTPDFGSFSTYGRTGIAINAGALALEISANWAPEAGTFTANGVFVGLTLTSGGVASDSHGGYKVGHGRQACRDAHRRRAKMRQNRWMTM